MFVRQSNKEWCYLFIVDLQQPLNFSLDNIGQDIHKKY